MYLRAVHRLLGPHVERFCDPRDSSSASSGKPSEYLSSNFFCLAGSVSGLIPSTTVLADLRHPRRVSRTACFVQPGVSALRIEVHEHAVGP